MAIILSKRPRFIPDEEFDRLYLDENACIPAPANIRVFSFRPFEALKPGEHPCCPLCGCTATHYPHHKYQYLYCPNYGCECRMLPPPRVIQMRKESWMTYTPVTWMRRRS